MSTISTHVLDTARGRPAAGVRVRLEAATTDGWDSVGATTTDDDGRAADLLGSDERVDPGVYRLIFDTGAWFAERGVPCFHPHVTVAFEITDGDDHYHV
ncbi:MAG TPA: hydroxyisourate hydrolase, partial [Euzebyales bacterium]|nr:hydroxyisourate hydrolase [Euzebyales bacterium]